MEEKFNEQKLILDDRKKLSLTGVGAIIAFSDSQIVVAIGEKSAIIYGQNLKIISFNKQTGLFCSEGLVNQIKFVSKPVSMLKKIFK